MKLRNVTIAAAVLAVALPTAASAQKITIKYLTAWDNRVQGTPKIAYRFGDMVKKATNGRITFKFSGPEVIKSRQQFQPTQRGVFDMNLSVAPYYIGTTGVTMAAFAMPGTTEDWRKKGYWDYFDKEMNRFNQKMISHVLGGTGPDVFHVMLKRPLSKGALPLKGRKIRANGFYKPVIEPLGGSMVNLNGGEIYSALQKGVVEGAAWPVQGAIDFKWYEQAKYMMRPRFGMSPYTVTMNMDRFKKLSKADQTLMLKLGREIERLAPDDFAKATEDEIVELKKRGVKETHLDPEVYKKMNAGFIKGVWNFAINFNKKSKPRVQKLYEMAKANGDAPASLK
ncbi:MAG: TRAP transporter substrate-binding protein DctP [Pseudomonadota bacterium]|nr:TRAP transporter substrate-binding protein DctP [Pseudomonadota bacterium]